MTNPFRPPETRGLLWVLALLAAARAPALETVPTLAVLRGPVAWILAVLAILVAISPAVVPAVSRLGTTAGRTRGRVLFAAAILVLLPIGLHYASRLRVSGDEPHYLLMAQSLWRDGDLDLRNNYDEEDWKEYTPGPVAPHYGATRRDGRPYPAHSPGLPLLLAPVYAIGGRAGCVFVLVLMAAGLAVQARGLALRLTGRAEAAGLAFAAALGPPALFYAFHVYTEVPSALAVASSLRLLLGPSGAGGAALAALLASTLPWLHVKMIPAAAALGVVGLCRLRGRPRVVFLAVATAMTAGLAAYYQSIFGRPTPLALYAGLPPDAQGPPLGAFFGLALDRSFGLLPYAPVFVLSLAGLGVLWRRRGETWPHLLVGLAVIAPLLTWRMWWGGQCPPARFLVPLVPALAVGLAVRASEDGRGLMRWRWALLGLGLALAAGMAADPGRLLLLNRGDRPTRVWALLSGEGSLGRYLPGLTRPDAGDWRVAGLWVLALLVLFTLDGLAQERERVDRLFRGLGLPLLLLLAIGLGVDFWARAGLPQSEGDPLIFAQGVGSQSLIH